VRNGVGESRQLRIRIGNGLAPTFSAAPLSIGRRPQSFGKVAAPATGPFVTKRARDSYVAKQTTIVLSY